MSGWVSWVNRTRTWVTSWVPWGILHINLYRLVLLVRERKRGSCRGQNNGKQSSCNPHQFLSSCSVPGAVNVLTTPSQPPSGFTIPWVPRWRYPSYVSYVSHPRHLSTVESTVSISSATILPMKKTFTLCSTVTSLE